MRQLDFPLISVNRYRGDVWIVSVSYSHELGFALSYRSSSVSCGDSRRFNIELPVEKVCELFPMVSGRPMPLER